MLESIDQCSSLVWIAGNFKRSNPPGAAVRIYTISCILTEAYMWESSSISVFSGNFFSQAATNGNGYPK